MLHGDKYRQVYGFSLLDKKALNAIRSLREKYRFYRGLRAWIGFKTVYIQYKRRKRIYGKSSYSLIAYINYAVRSFIGFSYLPLNLTIYLGLLIVIISLIIIFIALINFIFHGVAISGSVTLIFLITFFGGSQILAISVIGKYIQVVVEETKNRPMYIIESTINK